MEKEILSEIKLSSKQNENNKTFYLPQLISKERLNKFNKTTFSLMEKKYLIIKV